MAEKSDFASCSRSYQMSHNNDKSEVNDTLLYCVCQNCSKTFPSEAEVVNHLRRGDCSATRDCNAPGDCSAMHDSNVPGDCNATGDCSSTGDNNLMVGNYEVTGGAPKLAPNLPKMYECASCKVLCPTMEDLAYHMSEHSEKVVVVRDSGKEHLSRVGFTCTICHKVLGSKGNLVKHQAIHSGVKPYKCSFCDKTFSIKGNKDKHELIHTNTRKFTCEVCRKEFILKGNLRQHALTHSTVKYFRCIICNKEFTLKGNLDKHIKRHATGLLKTGNETLKKSSRYKNPYNRSTADGVNQDDAFSVNSMKAEIDTESSVKAEVETMDESRQNAHEQNPEYDYRVVLKGKRNVGCSTDPSEYDIYVQNL